MSQDILPKGSKKQIISNETLLCNQFNKPILSKDVQTSLLDVGMRIRKAVASGYKTKQADSPLSKSNIDIIQPTYPSSTGLSIKRKRGLS